MMVVGANLWYKCKCGKVYKTWEGLVRHKKVTAHLGIIVIEQ